MESTQTRETILIDGNSINAETLMKLSTGKFDIKLTEEAWEKVRASRLVIDTIVKNKTTVYGVNTGFGNFANVVVPFEMLTKLQSNLIRSHAVGVGQPLNQSRTRMLLALRVNTLAKGYSGISEETLARFVEAFNKDCLSYIPEQGTVGASGDLAPLAHLALGLLGEGKMWCSESNSFIAAKECLEKKGFTPLELKEKEGLALINGTQFMSALGAEAIFRAELLAKCADIIAAVSFEALHGNKKALFHKVHEVRNHEGQIESATTIRGLISSIETPSDFDDKHFPTIKVQDSYSLRCTPQVHGIVHDTIRFVKSILEKEFNCATDNPLVFTGETPYGDQDPAIPGFTISGGNFHGEYPAKVLDYLAIAIHEISSISERRIERFMNPELNSKIYPAFLVKKGGLNSGYMMIHVTAAALVSENKVLCHPSSIDTIPTSAGQEDHVSMGGWSARKVLKVIENVERVLAIELMAACQAIELRRPNKCTAKIEQIYDWVRTIVPFMEDDESLHSHIEELTKKIDEGVLLNLVKGEVKKE